MTRRAALSLSLTGIAALAFGAALWAHFGSLVYFDHLASAFVGCFF